MWSLYCLSFLDLRLLIIPFVSCGHCIVFPSSIVCPSSINDFWLPLWYLVAIVFSVLPRLTTSDYPFGIMWSLYCLSFLDLRFLITPLVSCGHCIVCPSSIYDFWLLLWYLVAIALSVLPRFYDFWLLLWYLVAIVLSVLPRFTTFDYPFGILWPLYCLSFFDFVFSVIPRFTTSDYPFGILGRCIVCPSSINDFWWPLWYLVAIVLSVLPRFTTSYYPFLYLVAIVLSVPPRFTTSDYPFCILWPLYCLSLLDLRLLITPLVSCGRCIVCPSSINDFWLPLWYLVAIVFSVLPRFTTSDYPFGILWPLYCLSFLDFVLSIIPRFCIVCHSSIYDFWLPLWYFVAIVLSVLPRFCIVYHSSILYCLSFLDLRLLITPLVSCGHCIVCLSSILYYLSFLDLRLLITPLVSCGHCVVCPSSIYDLWLSFWYIVAIVLSFRPRFKTSDYSFGILWPLYCLPFLDLRLLITPLVSCGHCIVCPSSIYDFWLPLWYHVAIVLSVLPHFTISDYPVGVLWPLYYLSLLDFRLLITPLVSCGHCIVCPSSIYDLWLLLWYLVAIVFSVLPRFTISDYPFGILWPLHCLSILDLRLLITPLVSCSHRIVCPSSIYDFWLPFWYLVAIVLSVRPRFTTSDYPFCILWPLYCLSLLDLRLLITPLVSCGRCIVCPSSINDFWLPLWYLVAIVLSVLPRFTTSDYPFGILWPLYCLSFLDFVLSIIPRFCIVCHSSIYDFWLPLWYFVAIVLSVLPRFCIVYHSSILYCLSFLDLRLLITPLVSCGHCIVCLSSILYYLSFLDLRLLITPLVSCGHCVVCPSSIYDLWLSFWYIVAIVLSFRPRFKTSDYSFGILWPLYCLPFLDLRLLITPLVSCGHCIVCPSSIYDFWLPLWYHVAIVLSVLPHFTISDYPVGVLWPLYYLSLLDFRLLITPLVSCGHCIVCPSSIYDLWLLLWYLVAIVFSVLPRFTISDYPFGILWPLHCLSILDLRLLITPLVSCSHRIVCPSSIYDFWLPFWYLVAIVLSVRPRFTTSDYPFCILWPLYCLSLLDCLSFLD